jgi:hypothetical protein
VVPSKHKPITAAVPAVVVAGYLVPAAAVRRIIILVIPVAAVVPAWVMCLTQLLHLILSLRILAMDG